MKDFNELTSKIINACYTVFNTLGTGFLEKVYENALAIELSKHGLVVETQKPVKGFYENQIVGDYFADLVIESEVIIELKAVKELAPEHSAQLINYLKASNPKVGLLINFHGSKPEIKRLHG